MGSPAPSISPPASDRTALDSSPPPPSPPSTGEDAKSPAGALAPNATTSPSPKSASERDIEKQQSATKIEQESERDKDGVRVENGIPIVGLVGGDDPFS